MKNKDPLAVLARETMNAARANARLRAATRAASNAAAAARRRQSPRRPKSASPPRRNNSPKAAVTAASAHPPRAFRGAIAHTTAPNGTIYYFMPEVPTNRNYNFSNPVPWPKSNSAVKAASAHPPRAFRGAFAHTTAPNGTVYYFMPEVPTGRNYNFSNPVPWNKAKRFFNR